MHMLCSFLRWISEVRAGYFPLAQSVNLCVRLPIVAPHAGDGRPENSTTGGAHVGDRG